MLTLFSIAGLAAGVNLDQTGGSLDSVCVASVAESAHTVSGWRQFLLGLVWAGFPEMVLYFYNAYAVQPQRVFNGHPPLATMGHRRARITTIRTVIPPVNLGNGWFDTVGTVGQSGRIWFTWRVWCGIGPGSGVGREW